MLPCLYCGDTSSPRDREHVLQASIGGNIVLPDEVCKHCNNVRLSALDGAFVSFLRDVEYRQHPDVSGGRDLLKNGVARYLDESGLWTDLLIGQDFKPLVPLQIVFKSETEFVLIQGEAIASVGLANCELVARELENPNTKIKALIVADMDPPVQPAIVRSARGKYMVRAADEDIANHLMRRTRDGTVSRSLRNVAADREILISQQPRIHGVVPVRFGYIARAAAKIALNFVCAMAGIEVALNPALDPLRSYILDGDPMDPDGQFVYKLKSPGEVERVFAREHCHTIVLIPDVAAGSASVFIILWQRLHAVVQLVKSPDVIPSSLSNPIAAIVDYRRGTHRIWRSSDDPLAFGAEFLSASGGSCLGR